MLLARSRASLQSAAAAVEIQVSLILKSEFTLVHT